MRELKLTQGSAEWAAHRRTARNASDAPALMGASPYCSRAELIRRKATGIEPEHDNATLARFQRGHDVEPALRAFAEQIIGEDLFPVVGVSDDGYLSASLDGVTMLGDVIAEFKQSNAEKKADIARGAIPMQDYPQIVQQFAVCDTATRCLYLVGDGTEDGTSRLWIERTQVEHDIPKLRAAWAQFDADAAAYQSEPTKAEVVAAPVAGFGALSLRVEGRVLASNMDDFRAGADAFLARLPKANDLRTDQDFANADAAAKACADAEDRIKAAGEAALAQMADVDAVLRTAEEVREAIRAARLALEKAVKAEKENRKASIVSDGRMAVKDHHAALNASLAVAIEWRDPSGELAAAIKGLRTIKSIEDAVAQVVANSKIAASAEAERHRANLAALDELGRAELFGDRDALVRSKTTEDLRNLAKARITDADAREQKRLDEERARIRAEEEAKAQREAAHTRERELQVERERIREEEAAKLRAAAEQAAVTTNNPPVAEPARAPAATASPAPSPPGAAIPQTGGARKPVGARIKLGDINARIAPLSINAQGLAELGFQPAGMEGAAKLYAESDFAGICNVLSARLQRAAAMQEAA